MPGEMHSKYEGLDNTIQVKTHQAKFIWHNVLLLQYVHLINRCAATVTSTQHGNQSRMS